MTTPPEQHWMPIRNCCIMHIHKLRLMLTAAKPPTRHYRCPVHALAVLYPLLRCCVYSAQSCDCSPCASPAGSTPQPAVAATPASTDMLPLTVPPSSGRCCRHEQKLRPVLLSNGTPAESTRLLPFTCYTRTPVLRERCCLP
jgi:hypothetical protein